MSDYQRNRGLKPLYTGIPIEVLRRIGETFREGFYKYDKQNPWEQYYKTLTPEDFLEVFNNAIEHLFNAYDEINNGKVHDGDEDHLSHAVVNLIMVMWATENNKLPNKLQVNLSIQEPPVEEITFPEPVEQQDSTASKIYNALKLKLGKS